MFNRIRAILATSLGVAALLITPLSLHAQAVYGSIYGTVTDSTGAAIPNATVTVTDVAKGTSTVVTTNDSGAYVAEHLIPDVYNVKVTVTGFTSGETNGIQVFADTSPKADIQLKVGSDAQTVTVNADSIPQLKTDRADVSTVYDVKTVSGLPLGNRNFTSLQLLLPGAQQLSWSHAANENPQGSLQIQIDGQAFGGVAYELDGADNQDPMLGIIVVNPALDAVTEAKIATQNFDAEFGKAVSAVVTAQTKSGSNQFHGSLFDYRQSNEFLARDPYTQFKPDISTGRYIPPGIYNQFGGSLGGPILKDKLFFFGDYQGLRQRIGNSAVMTVPSEHLINTCLGTEQPTAGGIAGCDFSEYQAALGANGIIYRKDGTAYANNVIPAGELSQPALNLLKLLQPYKPNTAGNYNGLQANYAGSGNGTFNNNQWDERVDWQASEKTHVFERFSRFTNIISGSTIFGAAGGAGFGVNGYGGTSTGANDSFAGGADIAVSPTLLTDFRLGYYRYNIGTSKYDQETPLATQLGMPGLNRGDRATNGAPAFNITDVGSFGGPSNPTSGGAQYGSGLNINRCNCPLTEREDQFQAVNNWTKIFGNHSAKFGADVRYARNLRVPSDTNRTGQLSFGTGPTSNPTITAAPGGNGFATFVLGDVTGFGRYIQNPAIPGSLNAKEFQKRIFFYAQDTWHATSKLTVNYGLRWELYFPEAVNGRAHGGLMNLNDGNIRVAGVGGVPSNFGWSPSWKALAPRLGIAYQVTPSTVVRAGYGRSFDIGVFGSIFGHVVTQNLPVLANQSINPTGGVTSSAFALATGPTLYDFGTIPSNGLLPSPGYAVNTKARPDPLRLPTIDAWNLSLQQAITPTLSFTLAYVGNKGTHTLSGGNGNSTNPNEDAIFLPAQFSVNGQTLHYDPAYPDTIGPNNGTANPIYLRRYYGGSLPACASSGYTQPAAGLPPNACGWTNDVTFYGNNQDTHYNALQLTVSKQFARGASLNANYAWQKSYNYNSSFATWNRRAVYGRDDTTREQSLVAYGVYELPFGRNQMFANHVNGFVNELIGGWQLSPIVTLQSGLPFTLRYNECSSSVPGSAPCYVSGDVSGLNVKVGSFNPQTHSNLLLRGIDPTTPAKQNLTNTPLGGIYAPGLDQIGNAGRNNKIGPSFFNTDLAVQKAFPIKESLSAQLRLDAYNAFNHINPGFGAGSSFTVDGGNQYLTGGYGINGYTNPRKLQISARIEF